MQSMSNFTLAPEEDDPMSSDREAEINRTADLGQPSETQSVRYQLRSGVTGVEMLPWPGVKPTAQSVDSIAIAMKYLIDGANRRAERNKN
jgi:hypothetical protein